MSVFSNWRLRRWKARNQGFHMAVVEVDEACYHTRELTVAERMTFREYVAENEGNAMLAIAWLVKTACFEFSLSSIVKLATNGPPTALARVSTNILEISGMTPGDEGIEVLPVDAEEDEHADLGTIEDAKKNSGSSVN